ncbi:hypothetical protein HSBAA_50330 [Vreelandella sulfidaeris]|uniref:TonB-dependent receptor plug domain-containing protein n=1 Tax=Vreelandella sulfidaeris TaxID=115553 RepID=A0A455UDM2_9GAMM|nr:hypothetical protein HSBAA_50330 [Halomonas sulfidaeris]
MPHTVRFLRHPLSLTVAALMSSTALAQPTQPLDTVQVVADSLNNSDSVVEADTLERYQAEDLGEIFDQAPQVNVGGSLGIAQKLYVRGVEDPLLNVTIDGANQSGSLFHHTGRIGLDPALLKRVEVSAGLAAPPMAQGHWAAAFALSPKILTTCCAMESVSVG